MFKFWTEKIIEIDPTERERPSLGLFLEKMPEVISVPRSNKRMKLKMVNGNDMMITNLGHCLEVAETLLMPTSPREFD